MAEAQDRFVHAAALIDEDGLKKAPALNIAVGVKLLLLALLAGLVSACGFQPIGMWPLTLLAFVLLLWLIERAPRLRSALAIGWGFGLGQFLLGLNWIATSFTYQAAMPAWLGWVAVVLLSIYLAIYPAVAAGLAWRYGRRDRLALALWLPAAWAVTEWLRATLLTGFAWNPVGVALLPTPASRLAILVGTYGLSAIAVLAAGAFWLLATRRLRAGGGLLAALVIASGAVWLVQGKGPAPTQTVLRIVQPNIGQDERWAQGSAMDHLNRIIALSQSGGAHAPRLLLWPESAVTVALQDERTGIDAATAGLRTTIGGALGPGDLLLTGGISLGSNNGRDATSATNSIYVLGRDGAIAARYDKAHLVPYGEYLPMRPLLSAIGISRLAPGDLDFSPGPGARTLVLPGFGKAGFQLCYEIIFSGQVIDKRDRPAFLFNPSNDAWFGAWGPPQHLAQARLRALEEGIPVLRATPTGISAVVDADGRLIAHIPAHKAAVIDARLPAPRAPTPFARFGNLLSLIFALVLAAGAIAVARKAR
jgi:apolipoprotein N-acyltransferase